MSILIKGMEMPKSGTYEVSIDNTNGKDKTIMSMFVRGSGGLICCGVYEIVPVPPHGRLIDASEKIRIQMYDDMTEDYHIAEMTIDDLLSQGWVEADAPTIIPADEPKEE